MTFLNTFQPQSDLFGLLQILALVFGEDPPVFSKQSHMAQSLTPNPGTFPHRISLPRYTHTESFQRSLPLPRNTHTESSPCPVSSSQYAYSGRSLYSGASPQYTNSELKAPVSMQGELKVQTILCISMYMYMYIYIYIYP